MSLSLFSPAAVQSVLLVMILSAIDYCAVFLAVLIDLRSGTLRARREGVPRTSRGYRRTVEKLSGYFVTMLALSVIDALLVLSALLLRVTAGYELPLFPLMTTLGAVGLTLIELKSVMENTRRKSDIMSAARSLSDMLGSKEVRGLVEELKKLKEM